MAKIIPFPESRCRMAQADAGAGEQLTLHRVTPTDIGAVWTASSATSADVADDYEPNLLADTPDGNVVLRAIAECEAARRSGRFPLPDIAWVIRSAMPWLRRRGRRWSSLPELHRGLLNQHCAAGDPTARMFCDWIEGRHLDGFALPIGEARTADSSPHSTVIEGGF